MKDAEQLAQIRQRHERFRSGKSIFNEVDGRAHFHGLSEFYLADVGWLLARLDAQTLEIEHAHTQARVFELGRQSAVNALAIKDAELRWLKHT